MTGNTAKFDEIRAVLEQYGITAVHQNLDIPEDGDTLEARCLSKARNAFAAVKQPLIVDDTGLYFQAFENFPGPFPKRVFSELGFQGILKKLAGKNRAAYFKTYVCYSTEKETRLFAGTITGTISETVYEGGHESLPYDRIFIPAGYTQPFCMLTAAEKNSISHRAQAVKECAQWCSATSKK